MIHPFDPTRLKPASYALSLGPTFLINHELDHLSELQPTLRIPPNSIAFVSMRESLRLPHYIAARFNLSIDLIYQGLLLGTGPQVDPGFHGVLSCPLHNISNQPILITLDDHLATIDFIKTTGIGEGSRALLESLPDEDQLYDRAAELIGYEEQRNVLFSRDKRWLRPILDYPPGERRVASSVAELQNQVASYRRFSIGALIGGLALLITMLTLVVALYADLKSDTRDLESRVKVTESKATVDVGPPRPRWP
jgi:hypothetical protein